MKKQAIICPESRLSKYEEELKKAKFDFEIVSNLRGVCTISVDMGTHATEDLYNVMLIIRDYFGDKKFLKIVNPRQN